MTDCGTQQHFTAVLSCKCSSVAPWITCRVTYMCWSVWQGKTNAIYNQHYFKLDFTTKQVKLVTLNCSGCWIKFLGSSHTKPPSFSKTSVPVIYLAGQTAHSLEALSLLHLDLAQQREVQRFRRAAAALGFLFLGLSLKLFSWHFLSQENNGICGVPPAPWP